MAGKRAEIKAVLSLDGAKFAAGLKGALGGARDFARRMSGTISSNLSEGMKSAGRKAMAVGTAGMIAAAAGVGMSIYKAMDMESLETQFSTLLGGMGNAKKRVAEIQKFADTTPFAMPEAAQASRVLEVLTKGALATGKGLRMAGDVAAGTGEDFSETAIWIGRLYDALQNNRPAGEALMRLSEIGAMASDTRAKIEELTEAGKGKEAWGVAEKAFGRFGGGMDALSKTFSGKLSTLGDTLSGVFRELGRPIMEALKPLLDVATKLGEDLQKIAKDWGTKLADAIRFGMEILKSGEAWDFIRFKLQEGMAVAANYLLGGVETATAMLVQGVGIALSPNTLTGLFEVLSSSGAILGASILDGLSTPLTYLQAGMEWAAQQFMASLDGGFGELMSSLAPWMDKLSAPLRGVVELISGIKIPKATDSVAGMREMAKGYKAESFQDILARRQTEGVDFFGMKTDEIRNIAKQGLMSGGAKIGTAMEEAISSLSDLAGKYKPSDAFKLDELVGRYSAMLIEDKIRAAMGGVVPSDAAAASSQNSSASMSRNGYTRTFVSQSGSDNSTAPQTPSSGGFMSRDGVQTKYEGKKEEKKIDEGNKLLEGVNKLLEDIKLTLSERALA